MNKNLNDITYIYILTDPISNEIKYVGKADNITIRLKEHIKKADYKKTHKNNWFLSLRKMGYVPIIEIIDVVSKNEWGFWEQFWIDMFKTWGFKLTNTARGGVGGNLGAEVNAKISERLKNRTFSAETIEKMRLGAKIRVLSDEGRKNLSKKRCGKNNPRYGKACPEQTRPYRKVIQLDLNSNEIKIWKGITIASKELNINRCGISNVCNGRDLSAGGYKWKYAF